MHATGSHWFPLTNISGKAKLALGEGDAGTWKTKMG